MTFGWNLFKTHSEGKSSFDTQVFIDMYPSYLFMTVSCSSCQGMYKNPYDSIAPERKVRILVHILMSEF